MKVSKSMVCIDCDTVFEFGTSSRCPGCGSTAIMPLQRCVISLETVKTIQTTRTEAEVCHGR
jgi:rRNA maturation endonuclease Nob1